MKFELFIAKRFLRKDKQSFSRPIVRIATISIALGLAVMIISLAILLGFKYQITDKIVGFGSHIQIRSFQEINTLQVQPVNKTSVFIKQLKTLDGVKSVQPTATIGGIIKTDDQINGVILKGFDPGCDTSFMHTCMKQGRFIAWQNDTVPSNEVLISSRVAAKLKLGLGDKLRVYFLVDNNLRARAFNIVGIYYTGLNAFDENYIIGDLKQVQRLNKWDTNQAEMIEVSINNFSKLDKIAEDVYNAIDYNLTISTIKDAQASMFAWLDLLDSNTIVILVVMALVSVVTMLSTLLIIIFERISMIGILKTMGATNASIRKMFLLKAALIIGKGILYGISIALLLCFLQSEFKIITLNSETYFLDYVPIYLNALHVLIISVSTLVLCILALIIPTSIISRVEPAKIVNVE